jgi:hypothetical protein
MQGRSNRVGRDNPRFQLSIPDAASYRSPLSRQSSSRSTAEEMNDKCNQGYHKQQVNSAPGEVERKPTYQPYGEQNEKQD